MNMYPNVKTCNMSPSVFVQLPPDNWKKLKTSFNNMVFDYEKCNQNWHLSGVHDVFESNIVQKQFNDFANNNSSILYLHEFVLDNPGILAKMIGELIYIYLMMIFYVFLSHIYLLL